MGKKVLQPIRLHPLPRMKRSSSMSLVSPKPRRLSAMSDSERYEPKWGGSSTHKDYGAGELFCIHATMDTLVNEGFRERRGKGEEGKGEVSSPLLLGPTGSLGRGSVISISSSSVSSGDRGKGSAARVFLCWASVSARSVSSSISLVLLCSKCIDICRDSAITRANFGPL